jgi:glycosyltransferase involved in cell wall biosynthesis
MRVLHLLKTAVGASWALRQTAVLVKLGVEVHLALPEGPMVKKYHDAGVKVHIFDPSINIRHPFANKKQIKKLRDLVADVSPDLIHSHFVATTLLMRLALKKSSIPRVFHVPGPLHLEHGLFRRVELFMANKHDYWLASCLWTRSKYLQCGIVPEKVGLAYYGVNADEFLVNSSQNTELRNDLGLSKEDFIIGMVAYFYRPKAYLGQARGLKGHEDLIDAMVIVNRQYPHVKCVFVGGPWGNSLKYFERVKTYAMQKTGDNCIFLGQRIDVPKLYPQFDLAVHPSHSENVGGAVESMYAQVSTLTSDVGGFPDLVTDGETGYIAAAKSPGELASKIIEAIDDPDERKKRVVKGLEKVTQVMNVEHNARQVHDFYIDVLRQENVSV